MLDFMEIMKYKMIIDTFTVEKNSVIMIFLGVLFYLYSNVEQSTIKQILLKIKCNELFKKPTSIVIPGVKVSRNSSWETRHTCFFSDNFRALWRHILKQKVNVKSMIEYCDIVEDRGLDSKDNLASKDKVEVENEVFMIYEETPFYLENDIYVQVIITKERSDDKEKKIRMDDIEIELITYKHDIYYLKDYIEKIKKNYINELKEARMGKKYLFTLGGIDNDDGINVKWEEHEFKSNRNFKNLFFEKKADYLKQIDNFINNKSWYKENGIPYTLGIALHGPPGTGKTSFIKALSNYLNRNIVSISLSMIQTEEELFKVYFEEMYKQSNKTKIGFEDKIIVFEDIDCMNDIVKKRENKEEEYEFRKDEFRKDEFRKDEFRKDAAQPVMVNDDGKHMYTTTNNVKTVNKKREITLSTILNLIDGLNENEGRILIITSNHYDKLDDALKRRGRIDIDIEMKKASKNIINEMFKNYFNKDIPPYYKNKIKDYHYSPCDVINKYIQHSNNGSDFLKSLTELQIQESTVQE